MIPFLCSGGGGSHLSKTDVALIASMLIFCGTSLGAIMDEEGRSCLAYRATDSCRYLLVGVVKQIDISKHQHRLTVW